ncbi:MAG: roadblock/LC7 domain-containing protein [Actinobacteria bacterium]|nr:roadblock/LC7 domain-containing protein [Actinomycetota bacterium]
MPSAKEAIQELLEMSPSIRHAVLVRGESEVLASTFANSQSEAVMVEMSRRMLEEGRMSAKEMDRPELTQLFIEANSGCVFIVAGEKDTWLAVSTGSNPTVGLVLYDVNTALRTALEGEADEGDYGK